MWKARGSYSIIQRSDVETCKQGRSSPQIGDDNDVKTFTRNRDDNSNRGKTGVGGGGGGTVIIMEGFN